MWQNACMPETLDLLDEDLLHLHVPQLDLELEHLMSLARLGCLPTEVEDYARCTDEQLASILGIISEHDRMVAGHKVLVAGLIAQRSRPELGLRGLAQSKGHRSAEEFLRSTTGSSAPEAKRTVALGRVVVEAAAQPDQASGVIPDAVAAWLHGPARALQAGRLSPEQFRAIEGGLGRPQQEVTVGMLAEAAARLVEAARDLDADALRSIAAEFRDELDEAGIADREVALVENRSFRITRLPDGMSRATWILDPESAAVVHEIFDRVTSPKLGGPRFVDPEKVAAAEAIEKDPRNPFQYASDVMLELLRQGVDHDPSRLLGSELPAVRVAVIERALESRTGHGYLEGTNFPVSIDTVERLVCSQGTQEVIFDQQLRPLDVERARRQFTRKQRIAMAVRDGGCLMCGRPPSWTEAHHVKHWVRDRGPTNIDDGLLLCRRCHQRVHREGWEFVFQRGGFVVIPPPEVDPSREPLPLPTRSRIMRDLANGGAFPAPASDERGDPTG
jgi:hypothetical protein